MKNVNEKMIEKSNIILSSINSINTDSTKNIKNILKKNEDSLLYNFFNVFKNKINVNNNEITDGNNSNIKDYNKIDNNDLKERNKNLQILKIENENIRSISDKINNNNKNSLFSSSLYGYGLGCFFLEVFQTGVSDYLC